MSNTSGLAKRLPADAPAFAAPGAPARPKVMRRPTHFAPSRPHASGMADTAPLPPVEAALPVASAAAAEQPLNRPWQDDARFGVVLVLVLLAVNTALLLALPYLNTAAPTGDGGTTGIAAAVTTQPSAPITLYTKPAPAPLLPAWGDTPAARDEAPQVNILGGEPAR